MKTGNPRRWPIHLIFIMVAAVAAVLLLVLWRFAPGGVFSVDCDLNPTRFRCTGSKVEETPTATVAEPTYKVIPSTKTVTNRQAKEKPTADPANDQFADDDVAMSTPTQTEATSKNVPGRATPKPPRVTPAR